MKESGTRERTASTRQWRRTQWAAYAACGWAFLFAALSFFWAVGGRTGLHPLEQDATSNVLLWAVVNLVAGILKVIMGLLALALIRWQEQRRYRKLLLGTVWLLGIGMCLYGGLGLISDVLHVTGIVNDPASWKWFFWYLVLWDPWWVLGGVLYVATAWFVQHDGEVRDGSRV